jgi:hypothetical protein
MSSINITDGWSRRRCENLFIFLSILVTHWRLGRVLNFKFYSGPWDSACKIHYTKTVLRIECTILYCSILLHFSRSVSFFYSLTCNTMFCKIYWKIFTLKIDYYMFRLMWPSSKLTKLRGHNPQSNHTDRATAALSAKSVPTFAGRGCCVVSATNSHGR